MIDGCAQNGAHLRNDTIDWSAQRRELLRAARGDGRGLRGGKIRGGLVGIFLWQNAGLGKARGPRVRSLGVRERGAGALRRGVERRMLERDQGIALRDSLPDNHEDPRHASGTRRGHCRKPIRSHTDRADCVHGLRENLNRGDRRSHTGDCGRFVGRGLGAAFASPPPRDEHCEKRGACDSHHGSSGLVVSQRSVRAAASAAARSSM